MECTQGVDNTFGPTVSDGCRGNFDFTLLFEQSIFQIAPCALLLLTIPLRALQLRRQSIKTLRTGIRSLKLGAITILAGVELALLVLWCTAPLHRTNASIPAAVLSFLACLWLLVLSNAEHTRTIRPSSIINTYILLSLVLDIPQARTLWLRPGPRSLPGLFSAGLAVKAVVLYLEARQKRNSLFPPYRLYAPESLVSLYNRVVVWWLNPLFLLGYRGIITVDRLYTIDGGLSSSGAEARFLRVWKKSSKAKGKRPLLWALISCLRGSLFAIAAPRLILSAFKLSQPILINRIVALLSEPDYKQDARAGLGLIVATVLVYRGLAISNALYKRQLHRFLTKIRGTIITAVHATTLVSPSDALTDNAVLTLITADINRVCFSLQRLDELFAVPVEVGVAIFLLQRQIFISCVAPVVLSLITSIVSFLNANRAVPMQKGWLKSVQERVAYTAAVLGCPKGFKMLGLTDYLTERIRALRIKELADYAQYRKYVTHRNCFSLIPKAFGPSLTLMMFTLINGGSALTPTVAFTTLSLVALLTAPIQELIHAVPMFQTALASLDRIQAFLLQESFSENTSLQYAPELAFEEAMNDSFDGVELHAMSSRMNHSRGDGHSVIRLGEADVRLGKDKKLVFENVSVEIHSGTLNLVVGPVGCGKSTLLKVILGEIKICSGQRMVTCSSNDYAYCAQDVFLPNGVVKSIILGQSEFDPSWYFTIIKACSLEADINTFPLGDDSVIGTKGLSLSGGQRQRLALARAVYARKKVLIADDALSGLDASTSQAVFDNVFGRTGLCKQLGTTVVLATHAAQYLPQADYITAIGSHGRIIEQGTFDHLSRSDGYVHELNIKGTDLARSGEQVVEQSVKADPTEDKLATAQQDLARRTGDGSVYKHYAKSIGWFYSSIIVTTAISFAFFETFPSLWVRLWAEAEVSMQHSRPLGLWIGIYLLFGALAVASCYIHIYVMLVYSVPKSSAQLHKQLLTTVMRAPYSFFVSTDSGVTLNRFSNDMSLIEGEMAGAVMQTMDGSCICVFSAALIAAGAKYAGLAMPFILIVLYAIQRFYLRTSRQLRFIELESQAPLLTHCSETVAGIATIRGFGWQHPTHQKCLELLDNSQRPFYLQYCIQRWLNLVLDLTTAGLAVIVVAMAMTLRETASAGSIGVSLLSILSFSWQLTYLVTAWTTLETSLGAVARCKSFEASTISEDLEHENHTPPAQWLESGKLEINNLSASYTQDGDNVLKGISLTIAAGEKVGICGRSGSGKSSFLLTLLRLLDNKTGKLILDHVDLSTVPRQLIRERVTALPQEVTTFPGSLRDNIDPLQQHTDASIEGALGRTALLDLVVQQGGLQTQMSDLSLSQGQLQLFAVARA